MTEEQFNRIDSMMNDILAQCQHCLYQLQESKKNLVNFEARLVDKILLIKATRVRLQKLKEHETDSEKELVEVLAIIRTLPEI